MCLSVGWCVCFNCNVWYSTHHICAADAGFGASTLLASLEWSGLSFKSKIISHCTRAICLHGK